MLYFLKIWFLCVGALWSLITVVHICHQLWKVYKGGQARYCCIGCLRPWPHYREKVIWRQGQHYGGSSPQPGAEGSVSIWVGNFDDAIRYIKMAYERSNDPIQCQCSILEALGELGWAKVLEKDES